MAAGSSRGGNFLPHSASALGTQQPAQASSGGGGIDSLKLQEANNICKAAYKEVMRMAKELNTWVVAEPALGSVEEIVEMFQTPPPDGMTVENSTASATIPTSGNDLIEKMMGVDKWANLLVNIVSHGTGDVPKDVLQHLRQADKNIKHARMVYAKFQLPTPFVPTRSFYFLRYLKEIVPNIYAIVDVSSDYFDPTTVQECRRRPSGVLVRKAGLHCEIIWVENVEVREPKDNIYSSILNSNLAFGARRWISTLQWKLKCNRSIIDTRMEVHERANACLLELTEFMKRFYMEYTASDPDEVKFSVVVDQELTSVLKKKHMKNAYIALTSFRVKAKPQSLFQFFVKKNIQLQWPRLPNSEEPEELVKLATDDNSNCITLHRKEMGQLIKYCLQEASWDEYCSFVISSTMSQQEVDQAIGLGSDGSVVYVCLQPSGFAIMPDGTEDLQSNGSLVTFVLQKQFKKREWFKCAQIKQKLKKAVKAIIREINKEVAGGGNDES